MQTVSSTTPFAVWAQEDTESGRVINKPSVCVVLPQTVCSPTTRLFANDIRGCSRKYLFHCEGGGWAVRISRKPRRVSLRKYLGIHNWKVPKPGSGNRRGRGWVVRRPNRSFCWGAAAMTDTIRGRGRVLTLRKGVSYRNQIQVLRLSPRVVQKLIWRRMGLQSQHH